MTKDIKRFSFSRFRTFHVCPLQHYYQYVEQVEVPESPSTIPGKLFHEAIEAWLKDMDLKPIFKEFRDQVNKGVLDMDLDQLEYTVNEYIKYYEKDYDQENTLMVEGDLTEDLEGKDHMTVVIDQVYERDGHIVMRDIKTSLNKLKYMADDMQYNQQLLLYLPYAEDHLNVTIDAIEIDEVKFGKIEPVPINANGKPSADRRRLANVTYESYYDELVSRGLEDEDSYKNILDYLEKRGHPLFNRVRAQVLDRQVIDSNINDMYSTYQLIKNGDQELPMHRVRSPLCNWCSFKDLCSLDMHNPTDTERDAIKAKIKSGK